jgi:hypothetical protein
MPGNCPMLPVGIKLAWKCRDHYWLNLISKMTTNDLVIPFSPELFNAMSMLVESDSTMENGNVSQGGK